MLVLISSDLKIFQRGKTSSKQALIQLQSSIRHICAVVMAVSWVLAAASASQSTEMTADDLYVIQNAHEYQEQKRLGYRPSIDRPGYQLTLPLDWRIDPFRDSSWRLSLHGWRMMNPIILRWYETKDPAVLRELIPYVHDWWQFHLQGRSTSYSWYDMATGIRAMRLAFIAKRWKAGDLLLTDEEKGEFIDIVNAHAKFLKAPQNVPSNNHGIFAAVGLRHMCREISEANECQNAQEISADYMRRVLASQYTDEGVQREHSPGYHAWVTKTLSDLRIAQWFEEVEGIPSLIGKARSLSGWFAFPDGVLARIGDTWPNGTPLESASDLTCIDEDKCFAVGDFSKSGWVIIRSDPGLPIKRQSMIFVTGMSQSFTHKHADDLSFELFERGERFLIDTGQFSFGLRTAEAREMRRYLESATGHNTVDLKEGVGRTDTRPYGSALRSVEVEKGEFIVLGFAPDRGGKFDQRRTFHYRPGEYLIVRDELSSKKPQDYISRLHFEAGVTLTEGDGAFNAEKNALHARIELLSSDCSVRSAKGQKDPLLGWKSLKRREFEPTYVLEAACPGQNREISWRITLQ